jgi:hypothetical protein
MTTIGTFAPQPLGSFHLLGGAGIDPFFDPLKPTAARLFGSGALTGEVYIEVFNFFSHILSC